MQCVILKFPEPIHQEDGIKSILRWLTLVPVGSGLYYIHVVLKRTVEESCFFKKNCGL